MIGNIPSSSSTLMRESTTEQLSSIEQQTHLSHIMRAKRVTRSSASTSRQVKTRQDKRPVLSPPPRKVRSFVRPSGDASTTTKRRSNHESCISIRCRSRFSLSTRCASPLRCVNGSFWEEPTICLLACERAYLVFVKTTYIRDRYLLNIKSLFRNRSLTLAPCASRLTDLTSILHA